MKVVTGSCLALLGLLATAVPAPAATIFTANLTGSQEVPPRVTNAFGSATLVLNDAQTALSMVIVVRGIDFTGLQTPGDATDNLTAAHIHAAANGGPGVNSGVVWGFIGTPFNDTNPTDTVVVPFTDGPGAVVTTKWDLPEGNNTTLGAQLPNILAGRSYLNFHTQRFPGGEIRGQILLDTPEPSTLVLFGLGAVGLVGVRRRKRAAG